jgi:UDP-glucose 4-epimerase
VPRAAVSGGAGFIGSHVVDLLVAEGWDVTIVDDLSTGDEAYLNPAATLRRLDVGEPGWGDALDGVDVCFHLAALPRIQPSFDDPVPHERVNVLGAINCVLACRDAGVRRIVYSSSSSVYGDPRRLPTPEDEPIDPLSPYALQKYAGERNVLLLGERHGVEAVCLRYFNVYGPRSFNQRNPYNAYSSVVGIFSRAARDGRPLQVTGDGLQERDFVWVEDVARANFAAALSETPFRVYNVGAGETISILRLAELFDAPVELVPERPGEARVTHADIGRIRAELGWSPQVGLDEGIRILSERA